ncbi:MAG: class I SAM-dependent methyltransferase [Myxococcales bacterium]|nr:class I SAM-dependent methyltransferase [Myxococcales bacterium]
MNHDAELARAFDGQAARFEKAPLQNDPAALARLVQFASLPASSHVLDVGCGPGIVSEALLAADHRVTGVDLSTEMLQRARARCARFGDRARFVQGSVFALDHQDFDAAISRFVMHHVVDPLGFVKAQVERIRPGGAVIISDHTTDPDPEAARRHQEIECARDKTHTRNLTSGELADLFARAGLKRIELAEDEFDLDFDEWFDRGTPSMAKPAVRAMAESSDARGFRAESRPDGGLTLHCVRTLIRGLVR